MKLLLATNLLFLTTLGQGKGQKEANCVTGRIDFAKERTFLFNDDVPKSFVGKTLNESLYDSVVDFGNSNIRFRPEGGVSLELVKGTNATAKGIQLSTLRYVQYAKITVKMTAIAVPGVVTSFITLSETGDEIDFEIAGFNSSQVLSNVFSNGIGEFGIHGGNHKVNTPISESHIYTIDWKSDVITWLIDGKSVREHRKNGPEANSLADKQRGRPWYPTSPSLVQLSVKDGQGAKWTGGQIPWTKDMASTSINVEYLDIQCYNDLNIEVPRWPITKSNSSPIKATSTALVSSTSSAAASQPTSQLNFKGISNYPIDPSRADLSESPSSGSISNGIFNAMMIILLLYLN
ncbi:glycosyl hydrolases family 16-domain-containing protein [Globomyces pollinis-pini]|nr:glycosyl hydrolases family 16-domain-containing protein [Globomyces pollinis-pini]